MSIQPLDLQVNIAQQTEVGRAQQAAQQAPIDSKHYADKKATQEAIAQQTKVQATNQPESEKVEAEGRGSTSYTPGRKKGGKEEEKEEIRDLSKDPRKGKFIDIVK